MWVVNMDGHLQSKIVEQNIHTKKKIKERKEYSS
jgi:hypothetical protein